MKNILKLVAIVAVVLVATNTVDAKTLSVGSTGSEVATLQTWLINNGYPIPLIEQGQASKGYFGSQTSTAVKIYQEDKGLDVTGVIDSEGYGNTKLGAVTGPNVYFRMFLDQGLTEGGIVSTSSTATTYTTDVRDFVQTPSTVLWTPNINTTVSLSSTSTFPYVPRVGDVARIVVQNASSTAASTITFAAKDANLDLQFAEATGGDLVLSGLDFAELTLIRKSGYKVTVLFNEFTEAD